jgi:hypothetical protein
MEVVETENIRQGLVLGEEEKFLRGDYLAALVKRSCSINGYNLVKKWIMPIYVNKYTRQRNIK